MHGGCGAVSSCSWLCAAVSCACATWPPAVPATIVIIHTCLSLIRCPLPIPDPCWKQERGSRARWQTIAFTRVDTQAGELVSRKDQIRKVQRRDCRGGGEESPPISRDRAPWNNCVARIRLEVAAGTAATAKLPAHVSAWGSACEIPQQVLLAFETVTSGSCACFIAICSQAALVCGVTHSLVCECSSAHAETGKEPRPASPRAISKLRIRRIFI